MLDTLTVTKCATVWILVDCTLSSIYICCTIVAGESNIRWWSRDSSHTSVWGGSLLAASSWSWQGDCNSPHPGCGPSAGPFTPLKLYEAWWPWGRSGSLVIQTAVMWSDFPHSRDPPGLIPRAVKVLHLKVTCNHLEPLACAASQCPVWPVIDPIIALWGI